jgi:hypothetical protein
MCVSKNLYSKEFIAENHYHFTIHIYDIRFLFFINTVISCNSSMLTVSKNYINSLVPCRPNQFCGLHA